MLLSFAQPHPPSALDAVLARAGRAIDQQRSMGYEQDAPDLMDDALAGEMVAVPPPTLPPVPTSLGTLEMLRQQARGQAKPDLTRAASAGQRIPENVVEIQAAMELDLALITGCPVGDARGTTFSTQGLVAASLGILRRTLCRALSNLDRSAPISGGLSPARTRRR